MRVVYRRNSELISGEADVINFEGESSKFGIGVRGMGEVIVPDVHESWPKDELEARARAWLGEDIIRLDRFAELFLPDEDIARISRYRYSVNWDEEAQAYVALAAEWPELTGVADTAPNALGQLAMKVQQSYWQLKKEGIVLPAVVDQPDGEPIQ